MLTFAATIIVNDKNLIVCYINDISSKQIEKMLSNEITFHVFFKQTVKIFINLFNNYFNI